MVDVDLRSVLKGPSTEELLSDPVLFSAIVQRFIDMFDREVYDKIVCTPGSSAYAGALAHRFGKGITIVRNIDAFSPERGIRTIIIGDDLKDGECIRSIISKIEENGGAVIKMGFVTEDTYSDARHKILKGIPLESCCKY